MTRQLGSLEKFDGDMIVKFVGHVPVNDSFYSSLGLAMNRRCKCRQAMHQ